MWRRLLDLPVLEEHRLFFVLDLCLECFLFLGEFGLLCPFNEGLLSLGDEGSSD